MTVLKRYKNMRPLFWFIAALLLFLILGVTLSISRQRIVLLEQANEHTDQEFSLLEAVISEDVIEHDYAGIQHYLTVFSERDRDIYEIKAVASDGSVLAGYRRADPATKPHKRIYCIELGNRSCVTLEFTHDLEPVYSELARETARNILASAVFSLLMTVILWYVLRKTAFIPLENALVELNKANAGLEEKVAERTAEWIFANTKLKNEIAERVAAERELVIKDLAIDTSVNGIVFAGFDGVITYSNSSCLRMWGYRNADEVIGRSVLEFWQSRDTAERAMRALQAAGFWFGELEAVRKNGTRFDVQVSVDLVRDAGGQPICMMASVVDITERKRAEIELRRERDFTATVLNTVGAIVLVLDREGRIVRFNRACEEVSGYTLEEARGRVFWEFLLSEEQREPIRAVFEMLSAGKFPSRYENYWVAKDGARRMISWSNTCVTDEAGAVAYVIATGIDITESRRATEELAKSETKRRLVVENISEIIYSMTLSDGRLQGTVDFLGGSVMQTVGYPISDFLRDPHLWLSLIHPEDVHRVKEETRHMVSSRAETTRMYRFRRGDTGTYLWLEDRIVPRVDDAGTVIGYFGVARDITRRKQAEDGLNNALARAEEEKNKSEAIIAAIGDAISIQDRDFRVLYQNNRHRDMLGNHVGAFCYEAYQKRDNVCSGCPVASSFEDGKVHVAERSRMTDSGRVYVEVSASPLRDASGNIVASIELVHEITDRKRAEAEVQRAYETQYVINALLRISLDGRSMDEVLLKSLDIILSSSWYVALSKGAVFLTEQDGEDLVLCVHRGFEQHMQQACSRVARGRCLCGRAARSGEIQFASHLDDRHEIRFEGISDHGHYCVPIGLPGKPIGVLALCLEAGHPHDEYEQEFLSAVANALTGIIQRKRMEEERERMIADLQALLDKVSVSRLEWQETFDSITDMISIYDEDDRIIKANKAFAARFGLTPREVVQKKCRDLQGTGFPMLGCPPENAANRPGPHTEERPDPATGRIFLVSTFPYSSPDSGKRGLVQIARDITETRENEARLMMSERLAALGKMASGIAHEINNPLAAIAGCVDGMNRRISRGEYDNELFRKYLSIMKEELARSKNITTSMLSFVQKRDYEKKPVDVNAALLKSLEIIGYQGRLKNVDVVRKLADGSSIVHGSEGELKQVFLIILTNALDAMNDEGTLCLETSASDGTLVITIADSGPGIQPENLTRIFNPFFTTKSERGGTGLGLSIANRIIAAHNGRIRITSPLGSGAIVAMEFPLA